MRLTAACSFMLLALAIGCAHPRLTSYAPQPIDHYRNVQTKNGLAIAVQPILDGEESTKYFGADFPARNTIPAYVIVENRHPALHFVLSRDRILLQTEQLQATPEAERALPSAPKTTTTPSSGAGSAAVQAVGPFLAAYPPVWIAVLAAAPFALLSEQERRNQQAISYQLRIVEIQSRTLAPGERVGGFAFFQLPAEAKLPEKWMIRLDTSAAGSAETTRFEFGFGPTAKAR